jgi:hypothetical protein
MEGDSRFTEFYSLINDFSGTYMTFKDKDGGK